ncbi:MAG: hypothetical protein ABIS69_10765 [Sediminibacterium sp.]
MPQGIKSIQGWRLLLLKLLVLVFLSVIIEWILTGLTSGNALVPFHNHYFSSAKYYLTSAALRSDFSTDTFATTRFGVYLLLSYLLYFLISIILLFFTKKATKITEILFYLFITAPFFLAFFFPYRKAVIDTTKKEIVVTRYHYLFIPLSTQHISFKDVTAVSSKTSTEYDGYNKKYISYLAIGVQTKDGFIVLGDKEAGEAKGTLTHPASPLLSAHDVQCTDTAIALIQQVIQLSPN